MPRSRMDELYALAEEHDGLLLSSEARALGIQDSVLVRLAQRGRLQRMNRGVYRIAHYPEDKLDLYREAILWARASQGPELIALSHETALLLYGISNVDPSHVNLSVPKSARLRRQQPEWITIHRADLGREDFKEHNGVPVTTVGRTVTDVLSLTRRADSARRAITVALRKGLIDAAEGRSLRKRVNCATVALSSSTGETAVTNLLVSISSQGTEQ